MSQENFKTKRNTLHFKVPADMKIKGNEDAGIAANETTDIAGTYPTKLVYTNYYLTITRARNLKWKRV